MFDKSENPRVWDLWIRLYDKQHKTLSHSGVPHKNHFKSNGWMGQRSVVQLVIRNQLRTDHLISWVRFFLNLFPCWSLNNKKKSSRNFFEKKMFFILQNFCYAKKKKHNFS